MKLVHMQYAPLQGKNSMNGRGGESPPSSQSAHHQAAAAAAAAVATVAAASPLQIQHTNGNSMNGFERHLSLFNHPEFVWRYGSLAFSSMQPSLPPLDFKNQLPTNLACDPRLWNKEDVMSFLHWCELEFDLPRFDIDLFQMNGKALCLLTKQDLGERCPGAGDLVYNVLRWLIRDGLQQHMSPRSPVTPHFPLTPSWCLPLHPADYPQLTIMASNLSNQRNTITISPAPSIESQSGSPNQEQGHHSAFPMLTNNYRNGASSGSNPSDSEMEDVTESGHSPIPMQLSVSTSNSPPYSPQTVKSPLQNQIFFSTTPPTPLLENGNGTEQGTNGRLLWDFLQQLLNDNMQRYTHYITWKNRESGVFKIVDPPGLAKLWGIQKNHLSMNYDKMSRALRYYYRVNILRKVQGERHCYQFLRNPCELKSIKNISLLRQQTSPSPCTVIIKTEPVDENGVENFTQLKPTDLSIRSGSPMVTSPFFKQELSSPSVALKSPTQRKASASSPARHFQFPQDLTIQQVHPNDSSSQSFKICDVEMRCVKTEEKSRRK